MILPQNTPESACCLGCGYLLRGLEQPVCPECGRKFDHGDPKSFAASPKVRVWRRWRWRLVGLFAFVLLLIVAAPRGRQFGTLNFTCKTCGESLTLKRWQPLPPKWMPRYPGYTSMHSAPSPSLPNATSCPHKYTIVFSCKGGHIIFSTWMTADGSEATGYPTINGQQVTPTTAKSDLRILMDPMIAGVGP